MASPPVTATEHRWYLLKGGYDSTTPSNTQWPSTKPGKPRTGSKWSVVSGVCSGDGAPMVKVSMPLRSGVPVVNQSVK
jgi:hypothetical protein